jgi:hypothetical protein
MLTGTKKGQKNIVKAAFLAVYAAFLLAACQNGFINDALESLNPSPAVVAATPKIDWGTDRVLYIDPRGGTMAGTLSGQLDRVKRSIWFKDDQTNSNSKKWEFVAPSGETYITPEFLTTIIGGKPSINDNVITLTFGTIADTSTLDVYFDTPGQNYSFILYPSAFTGAHSYELSTEAATLNFKVEMPSETDYAGRLLARKADYTGIVVSWTEADAKGAANAIEGMKLIAGSLAAYYATEALGEYLGSIDEAVFDSMDSQFSENAGWMSPSDNQLAKGYWDGNGAFRLDGFYIDTQPSVQPEISVPVKFTSDAGDAVAKIQQAEAAGSFSNIQNSVGSVAIWETVVGALGGLTLPVGGSEAIWIGGGPATAGQVAANDYPMSIILEAGNDGSPANTVTITVKVVN